MKGDEQKLQSMKNRSLFSNDLLLKSASNSAVGYADDGVVPATVDWSKYQSDSSNLHHLRLNGFDSSFMDNRIDLCENFGRMCVRSEQEWNNPMERFGSSVGRSFGGDGVGFQSPRVFNDDIRSPLNGFQGNCRVGDSISNGLYSCYQNGIGNRVLEERNRGIRLQNGSFSNLYSEQCGLDYNGNHLVYSQMMDSRMRLNKNRGMRNGMDDGIFIGGNGRNYTSMDQRKKSLERLDNGVNFEGLYDNGWRLGSESPLKSVSSLTGIEGYIYYMAKDQKGCRFLQNSLDEGTNRDVQIIFNGIINHVVELITNQFGNYLLQKLLDVCTEEQRTHIVYMLSINPRELLSISLHVQGTRVIQKLIDTLKTKVQIEVFIQALEPNLVPLMMHLHGNHVLHRCFRSFSNEDNMCIFEAATESCVSIATDQYGCCILQDCIDYASGEQREKMVSEISRYGLRLAQDPYGNYVIQYIIGLEIPSVMASLISQFNGYYIHLSMQKYSSHVVERCLWSGDEFRSRIIHEWLSKPNFKQLLQDQFANYVIQVALEVTEGHLHSLLVEAIRPHMHLRTSPYCKKIFSLLKK